MGKGLDSQSKGHPGGNRRGVLGKGLCFLSALGFASVSIFGKLGHAAGMDTLSMLTVRFGGAALVMGAILLIRCGKETFPGWGRILPLLLLGAVGYAGQTGLFFLGLERNPASLNTLIYRTYPLFVVLLDWVINNRKIYPIHWVAIAIAAVGLLLTLNVREIVAIKNLDQTGYLSLLFPLGAAALNATYLIYSEQPIHQSGAFRSTVWILVGASMSTAALGIAFRVFDFEPMVMHVPLTAGLILISTIVPVFSFLGGIFLVGPAVASLITTAEPILTIVFAFLILGETLNPVQLIGGGVLILMVSLVSFTPSPPRTYVLFPVDDA